MNAFLFPSASSVSMRLPARKLASDSYPFSLANLKLIQP